MNKSYTVIFTSEARQSLKTIDSYLAEKESVELARRHVRAIVNYCVKNLKTFPYKFASRPDIAKGVHITNYKGSTIIAYNVDEQAQQVRIIRVINAAQDYPTVLKRN